MYLHSAIGQPRPHDPEFGHFRAGLEDFYLHPADYALEPFRIFGNLYYIGDKKVCSHLIDTGDGLIVFDTGFRHAAFLLTENIRKLGFDPADIRYIIHTHEHFDHFGASEDLRKLYGCKLCMSAAGTQLLKERPDRALVALGPQKYDSIPWPDIELEDGEILTLGNTAVRCVLTPGHTGGVMTFFFDATDGDRTMRAGLLGGAGFLTMLRGYSQQFGLPTDMPEQMLASIGRIWDEPVEITLGNHPSQNCTLEKRQWMLEHPGENPFLDKTAWHFFLELLQQRVEELIELGY